jgi:hypothetical protein
MLASPGRRFVLACALVLACPPAGRAWNDLGHMVVATIAQDHLTSAARAAVDRLVAIPAQPPGRPDRGDDFVAAACWADDVRVKAQTGTWHYVDLPIAAAPGVATRPPKPSNAVTALRQNERILRDPKADDAAKAVALRYVIHVMGDLHQPLHCESFYSREHPGGDAGGNDFKIKGSRLGARNLHALWDQGCGVLAKTGDPGLAALTARDRVRRLADRLERLHPRAPKRPAFDDYAALAAESSKIAQTVAYVGIEEGQAPSQEYLRKGREVSERRLALAGERLAEALNAIFDPASTPRPMSVHKQAAKPRAPVARLH